MVTALLESAEEYLIMCFVCKIHVHPFIFFLYLILFGAVLENMVRCVMCMSRDMDHMLIMVCPAVH